MIFTQATIIALLPLILTCGTATAVMLAIAARRNHWWNATLAVLGLNAALLSVAYISSLPAQSVTDLLVVDHFACVYMAMALIATLACTTLAHGYMETHPGNREENYLLLVLSVAGALVLACSHHLASFFIGIEMLSVPLYGLVAYSFQRSKALEAGIKYIILSAVGSAMLLFGMALVYAQTGQLSFSGIHQFLLQSSVTSPLMIAGFALIFVAVAFKLSLVPFHLWTPDVYEGAPAPVTAYLATVSKLAVVAVFIRLIAEVPQFNTGLLRDVMGVIAGLSIIVGNLLALTQNNLKRMLGYSSIAHLGYLLIAIVAGGAVMTETVTIYLLTYLVTSLAAFGVMVLVSSPYRGADADNLHNYRGLFWQRPYLTAVLTVSMLSMAGIPLTAGFIGKFFVVLSAVGAHQWWLLAMLVIGSAIGLYYYLRVLITLYLKEAGITRFAAPLDWGRTTGGMLLLILSALVLVIGAYPQPFIHWVDLAVQL